MTDHFLPMDVQKVLVNPIYAGIRPFPRIVGDDEWIAAGVKQIAEVGAAEYLKLLLLSLRESMEWAHHNA